MERSLGVLGALRVVTDSGPVTLRPAQRRLLSMLLVEPRAELERDVLIDRMWGEATPATATTALHVHVSGLRRAVPGLVSTTPRGYRLETDTWTYDRAEYDALARQASSAARSESWAAVRRLAASALALWRGEPFEELRDDDFAVAEIRRLVELHSELTELHARALLTTDGGDEAVTRLRRLIAEQPLRESAWEQLMLGLYRAGRPAEALRAFQDARRVLAEEIGVEPGPALRLAHERIQLEDASLGAPDRHLPPHTLPTLATSFVGRENELRAISELLADQRVITILGGPGYGKTRLALEAGRLALEAREESVWFAPLAEAHDELAVVASITRVVGLHGHLATIAGLADALSGHAGVLILDNCEHVRGTCAELIRRLARSSPLRILATSRIPLEVESETLIRIEPLPAPPAGDMEGDLSGSPLASAAARLFVDRARDADRSYRFTPATAPLVAELCRLADGIPLALELAASWVPALGLADIQEMLGATAEHRALEAGEPAHHRSLQATIEWSTALLAPEDRRLFMALAIFNGTFALEDVADVCAPGEDRRRLAAAIPRLVDASLIVVERRDGGRVLYRTLIPIRDWARDRARRRRGWPELQERFVRHYLGKAQRLEQDLFRAPTDLSSVDDDLDNLRAAFELGLALGLADDVGRALTPLDTYFLNRYLTGEERAWLARVLPLVADPLVRAHVLRSSAAKAQVANDLDESRRLFSQAIDAYRQLDDSIGLGRCLLSLAALHANRGEWNDGLQAALEARQLVAAINNPAALAIAAFYVGENLANAGRVEEGLAEYAEAARQFQASGETGRESYALSAIAHLAVVIGDERLARDTLPEAVDLARRSESAYRLSRVLAAAAAVEARWGDIEEARRQLLEVDTIMQPQGSEEIFEYFFPAAFVCHRLRLWDVLIDGLSAAERWLAASGTGYRAPWRHVAAEWKREASEAGVDVARRLRRAQRARDPAAIRAEMVRILSAEVSQIEAAETPALVR